MIADEIRTAMRSTPFRPFRVHLADGTDVLIHHHDYAWLQPSGLEFYVEDLHGETHFIDTNRVTKLTLAKRGGSTSGDGGRRRKRPRAK